MVWPFNLQNWECTASFHKTKVACLRSDSTSTPWRQNKMQEEVPQMFITYTPGALTSFLESAYVGWVWRRSSRQRDLWLTCKPELGNQHPTPYTHLRNMHSTCLPSTRTQPWLSNVSWRPSERHGCLGLAGALGKLVGFWQRGDEVCLSRGTQDKPWSKSPYLLNLPPTDLELSASFFSFFSPSRDRGQFANQQLNRWLRKRNATLFPEGSAQSADIAHKWMAEALLAHSRTVLKDNTDGKSPVGRTSVAQLAIRFAWKERGTDLHKFMNWGPTTPAISLTSDWKKGLYPVIKM